jgi:pimeloyl-ACP methyl ester carboxylesterase
MTPRVHRTTSADGTALACSVQGIGPPLALVPGGPADGETGWLGLLPHLVDHVTCFTINTRGRGLSDDHPDHARERLVEDVVAVVESIGDEVHLFGHSAGGTHALEAAASTSALGSLLLYEPTLFELADEPHRRRAADAAARARAAAASGQLAAAARIFLADMAAADDAELQLCDELGAAEGMAPLMPVVLEEVRRSGLPQLTSLSLLDHVEVPVHLLHGTTSHPFYREVVRGLVERLADTHVHELPGLGHLGPEVAPAHVAEALVGIVVSGPVAVGDD